MAGLQDGVEVVRALEMLPRGTFVMTAAYDSRRGGVVVHWVESCAEEPRLVSVAARKGHPIDPLIRDSHAFGICMVDPEDKLLLRKFSPRRAPDDRADQFLSFQVERLVTGSPILKRSLMALDCEVVRHVDLEADHELFVGQVVAGRVYRGGDSR